MTMFPKKIVKRHEVYGLNFVDFFILAFLILVGIFCKIDFAINIAAAVFIVFSVKFYASQKPRGFFGTAILSLFEGEKWERFK